VLCGFRVSVLVRLSGNRVVVFFVFFWFLLGVSCVLRGVLCFL
jgi:hypothetical protein